MAYAVAATVLAVLTLVGDPERTVPLWAVVAPWSVIPVIDLIVAFSYTVSPRSR